MDAEGFLQVDRVREGLAEDMRAFAHIRRSLDDGAKRGVLLDYDQALEPDTGSVVSYASMGFYL